MNVGEAIDRIRRHFADAELSGELHSGPVSKSYLVRAGGAELVMRVDTGLARCFPLDRRLEVQIMSEAAAAGFAPRVMVLDFGPPAILLREFIPGRPWTADDTSRADQIARLAKLLRSVHLLSRRNFAGRTRLADVIRCYMTILGPGGRDVGADALALLARLEDSPSWPVAVCHRDPTPGNVLEDSGGRLWLNDWEYAGLGDPLFDVAAAASAAENMLEDYVENPPTAGLTLRFAEFRRLYALILILWLRVLEREQPLTDDQSRELRESEQFISVRE